MWCRDLVVATTAQLHLTKSKLRFCAGSNPARSMSKIRDDEDLNDPGWKYGETSSAGQPYYKNNLSRLLSSMNKTALPSMANILP